MGVSKDDGGSLNDRISSEVNPQLGAWNTAGAFRERIKAAEKLGFP